MVKNSKFYVMWFFTIIKIHTAFTLHFGYSESPIQHFAIFKKPVIFLIENENLQIKLL